MTLLRLQREPSSNGATLGALYVNDVFECWTVEDVIREPRERTVGVDLEAWVKSWKVAHETAIPSGRYEFKLYNSPRFGRIVPLLLHVPGFSMIEIHPGNNPFDTHGCILVGQGRGHGTVDRSRAALDMLMVKIADGPFVIDILNPPGAHFAVPGRPRTGDVRAV